MEPIASLSAQVIDKKRMMAASQEPGVDLYVLCKRKAMSEAGSHGFWMAFELCFVDFSDHSYCYS